MTVKSVLVAYDFAFINGGQAKVAIDSARLLADAGMKVTYFAAVGPVDPLLDHPGIDVEVLGQSDILTNPSRSKAMATGIWNAEARRRLTETAKKFDPATSVLHCHGYAKALSPSIGPVLANGPLRSVYTMHEYFLACPNGGFYDFQRNEICTRTALGASCLTTHCDVRHRVHKAWRVARQVVTRGPGQMPRGLHDIIYISETQRRAMAPYLPPSARLHHVPNPVPKSTQPTVNATENNVFLFVGRLNPEKGGLMFAKAAKAAGVQAVFVGDGPEAEAIHAANPEAKVLGWQSPDVVQHWLGQACALVFPSLWYETFGLVAYEALQRHVPVICGRWNAAAECVIDGKTGVIFDLPDEASLTGAIRQMQHLGPIDAASVPRTSDTDAHLKALQKVYSTVLPNRDAAA